MNDDNMIINITSKWAICHIYIGGEQILHIPSGRQRRRCRLPPPTSSFTGHSNIYIYTFTFSKYQCHFIRLSLPPMFFSGVDNNIKNNDNNDDNDDMCAYCVSVMILILYLYIYL